MSKQAPKTASQVYADLDNEPLPLLSGWARTKPTVKYHYYDQGASLCAYQRGAGVLTFAEADPAAADCCSSCLLHRKKAHTNPNWKTLEKMGNGGTSTAAKRGRRNRAVASGEAARKPRRVLGAIIAGGWLDESTQLDQQQLAGLQSPCVGENGPTLDQLYGAPTVQRPTIYTHPEQNQPRLAALSNALDDFGKSIDRIFRDAERRAILEGNPT